MSCFIAAAGIGRSHFCMLLPVLCTHRTAPATDPRARGLNTTCVPSCVCVSSTVDPICTSAAFRRAHGRR
uniref:Putative secreted protein n=1 Tax=Anopheles darlingi TaxID=43151 RepID=A0A2M4DNM6_ANODA